MTRKGERISPERRRLLASALYAAAGSAVGPLLSPAFAQNSAERLIISGASGQLGGLTVELIRLGVPAERLILVSRTPQPLEHYAAKGAAVRYGDFTEPE